jgi:multimeric flavodoxin WrbA
MKILGISSTHRKNEDTITDLLLEEALAAAKQDGAEVEKVKLSDYKIHQCLGCGNCHRFMVCPLTHQYDDQTDELLAKVDKADGIIFSYPTYNLLPPGMLVNFFQRIAPKEEIRTDKPFYVDMYPQTKGYAFMHKKVGLICTGFTIGMENASGSLFSFFATMRTTVTICANIALNEFNDLNIKTTNPNNGNSIGFAYKLARSVGRRVLSGTSAFETTFNYLDKPVEDKNIANIFSCELEDLYGNNVRLGDYKGKRAIILIGGQKANKESVVWMGNLLAQVDQKEVPILPIASVEKLPGFLTKDFIKEQIKIQIKDSQDAFVPILDWDGDIAEKFNVSLFEEYPTVVIIDENGKLVYRETQGYSKKNLVNVQESLKAN